MLTHYSNRLWQIIWATVHAKNQHIILTLRDLNLEQERTVGFVIFIAKKVPNKGVKFKQEKKYKRCTLDHKVTKLDINYKSSIKNIIKNRKGWYKKYFKKTVCIKKL